MPPETGANAAAASDAVFVADTGGGAGSEAGKIEGGAAAVGVAAGAGFGIGGIAAAGLGIGGNAAAGFGMGGRAIAGFGIGGIAGGTTGHCGTDFENGEGGDGGNGKGNGGGTPNPAFRSVAGVDGHAGGNETSASASDRLEAPAEVPLPEAICSGALFLLDVSCPIPRNHSYRDSAAFIPDPL